MELTAQKRDVQKQKRRDLEARGLIPAELYGHGVANEHLAISHKDFIKVFKEAGGSTVITLKVGRENVPVIIHDMQKGYLHDAIMHVDLYRVRMDEKITATVPLEFTGEASAVKEYGGVLNKALTEVEVEALPGNLPHHLEVPLGLLNELDKSIYVKDLQVPAGVEFVANPEAVIISVVAARTAPVEPELTGDVAAVKVEGEEKKTQRDAQKSQEERT